MSEEKKKRTCSNCGSEDLEVSKDFRRGVMYVNCNDCGRSYELSVIKKPGPTNRRRPEFHEEPGERCDWNEYDEDGEYGNRW